MIPYRISFIHCACSVRLPPDGVSLYTNTKTRAKMEKDMTKADRKAKKERKALEETAAANKAEDLITLSASDGGADGGKSDKSDNDTETNDGGSQRRGAKNISAELAKRSPEEVFQKFDTDGSGLIDFDEFRAMLPQVGIKISLPKVSHTCRVYLYIPVCDSNERLVCRPLSFQQISFQDLNY